MRLSCEVPGIEISRADSPPLINIQTTPWRANPLKPPLPPLSLYFLPLYPYNYHVSSPPQPHILLPNSTHYCHITLLFRRKTASTNYIVYCFIGSDFLQSLKGMRKDCKEGEPKKKKILVRQLVLLID